MRVSRIRDVKLPTRGTAKSAGIDFYVPMFDEKFMEDFFNKNGEDILIDDGKIFLDPQHRVLIPSGIRAKVPEAFALIAYNKSGVSSKKGLDILASVVDEDYQGEIHISLVNTGSKQIEIIEGEKIVQFLLMPILGDDIEESDDDELFEEESQRGRGGFGSTGI